MYKMYGLSMETSVNNDQKEKRTIDLLEKLINLLFHEQDIYTPDVLTLRGSFISFGSNTKEVNFINEIVHTLRFFQRTVNLIKLNIQAAKVIKIVIDREVSKLSSARAALLDLPFGTPLWEIEQRKIETILEYVDEKSNKLDELLKVLSNKVVDYQQMEEFFNDVNDEVLEESKREKLTLYNKEKESIREINIERIDKNVIKLLFCAAKFIPGSIITGISHIFQGEVSKKVYEIITVGNSINTIRGNSSISYVINFLKKEEDFLRSSYIDE